MITDFYVSQFPGNISLFLFAFASSKPPLVFDINHSSRHFFNFSGYTTIARKERRYNTIPYNTIQQPVNDISATARTTRAATLIYIHFDDTGYRHRLIGPCNHSHASLRKSAFFNGHAVVWGLYYYCCSISGLCNSNLVRCTHWMYVTAVIIWSDQVYNNASPRLLLLTSDIFNGGA